MSFRSIVITHPEIAKEWDYNYNKDLTPEAVSKGMQLKVGWFGVAVVRNVLKLPV